MPSLKLFHVEHKLAKCPECQPMKEKGKCQCKKEESQNWEVCQGVDSDTG